ncbi:RHS repeat-associated core domain-containing protein [Qipengyuania sp. DGS5-3]|uniref:RHS repeat-associated core domain-containing protein n=1 Tax=Qipengyuania sp. DGS5-3 TaxID=3349632 RepID=UPI0036D3A086
MKRNTESQLFGTVPEEDDWRRHWCDFSWGGYKCPDGGCGLLRPGYALAVCPSGYIPTVDGYCRAGAAREQEICVCDENGKLNPAVGNPIVLSTGAKALEAIDYATADGRFQIGRTYRSLQIGKPIQGATLPFATQRGLTNGWNFSFNREIQLGKFSGSPTNPDATVAILLADGTAYGFKLQSSGNWVEDTSGGPARSYGNLKLEFLGTLPPDLASIRSTSSTWRLTDGEDTVWTLVTHNGGFGGNYLRGWPTLMVARDGYQQTFTYAPDSSLTSITDSFGRSATFGWGQDIDEASPPPAGAEPVAPYINTVDLPDGTSLRYDFFTPVIGYLRAATTERLRGGPLAGRNRTSGRLWLGRRIGHTRLVGVQRIDQNDVALDSVGYAYENEKYPKFVTGIIDHRGVRVSRYTYDDKGRVISSEGAESTNLHTVQYGSSGGTRTRNVTSPLGKQENFAFSPHSGGYRLSSIAGQASAETPASTTSISYGGGTFIASQTDAEGNQVTTTRDNRGRPLTIVEGSGTPEARTTTITWHPTYNVATSIVRDGLTETRNYDAQGRLQSVTHTDATNHTAPYITTGQARTTSYTWDANGRLLSLDGPLAPDGQGNDDITTFTYDTSGNLLTSSNAQGHVSTYGGYDANGRPTTMTDANGQVTSYVYDELGRATSVTVQHPTNPAKNAVTTMVYDAIGQVTEMTLPATDTLLMDYDGAGRLTAMHTASGERMNYTYDAAGNVTRETVSRSNGSTSRRITRAFDELGRLIRQTTGVGKTSRLAYDRVGNVTSSITPAGNQTTAAFDALDRLVSTVAPDGGSSAMAFDNRDNMTGYTDPISVATQFVYNGFGEVIQEVSPDRGTSTYTYDDAGRMTQSTDGRGQVIDYAYDVLGRITSKVPQGRPASEAITYAYDTGGLPGSYAVGRLASVTDGTGTTLFAYDHRGNLTAKQQGIGTSASAQLAYTYDVADRITQITYPSGRQVQYSYDSKGRVASVQTRASASIPAWTNVANGHTYEPFGPVTGMQLGNGLAVANDRGNDGRLASRRLYRISDNTSLSHLTYRYTAEDYIGGITDELNPANSQLMGYDANGRLNLSVISGQASNDNHAYSYTSGTNQLAEFTQASGSRQYSYDGRGNMLTETRPGGVTVAASYDGYGRLISYNRSNAGAQSYSYNGLDDRVAMTKPTTGTRHFVYDAGGRVIGEYGASASDVWAEFIWANPQVGAGTGPYGGDDGLGGYMPMAVATPDVNATIQLIWVHGNHLGVPTVVSDDAGNAVPLSGDYLLPGFPGQSRIFSDLYYNRYRDYDPVTGRYIQADPIGLGGGSNNYVYALNNPVNYMDPDGLSPLDLLGSGQFGGIKIAGDALAAANARNAGYDPSGIFCIDPWDVGLLVLGVAPGGKFVGQAFSRVGKRISNRSLKAGPKKRGSAPIGKDGHPIELHHRGQKPDSPIDEMTRTDHRGKGNFSKNHQNTGKHPSKIDRDEFNRKREQYWKDQYDSGRFDNLDD